MSDTGQRREMSQVLPDDGNEVTATTYESIEYDREAREITGTLSTGPSPFGTKCWVDGVAVDPDTVRLATKRDA